MQVEKRIQEHLNFLYGPEVGREMWEELKPRLDVFHQRNPHLQDVPPPEERLTERDAILITYGDQVTEPDRPPLRTLADFLTHHLQDTLSGVHILPFFPYSSDDGFSVIDYRRVNPALGTWADIAHLGKHFRLMFDAVINHVSRRSAWFQAFLRDEPPYTDYFIVVDPDADLSTVVRPRATPLLTPVETAAGVKHVWTTFSADQIDLNYKNPRVLLAVIDTLLFYIERGASIIRLDAIAYLWKEPGTPCIHLPQTHAVVKLFRAIFDLVAPGVLIITETNVPHRENISYFGDGSDEAQLVYNFALPPLILHTFHTGNSRQLTEWAASLDTPSHTATFFNFIASHDGIGVMPARGLLSEEEIHSLVRLTLAHGGQVSYTANPDGSRSVYELNITLYDALNDPQDPDPDMDVPRFLASQAIMLSLSGVPGIYAHSLFGSRNCHTCVQETGRARSINREKCPRAHLEALLADPETHQHRVFQGYLELLRARRAHPAFHPNAAQHILRLNNAIFAVARTSPDGEETVLCLTNVSDHPQTVLFYLAAWGLPAATEWYDLIEGESYVAPDNRLALALEAYQTVWLRPEPRTGTNSPIR